LTELEDPAGDSSEGAIQNEPDGIASLPFLNHGGIVAMGAGVADGDDTLSAARSYLRVWREACRWNICGDRGGARYTNVNPVTLRSAGQVTAMA